jgi:aldose 1-epimerase
MAAGDRMIALLKLTRGDANLVIAPELGGGIARLDIAGKPALRPWSAKENDGPFALASNILVPFSNRISGGGFSFRGERYQIAPNREGEQFPIHGDGFQKPWTISGHDENSATLTLENGNIGPFQYCAEQVFSLTEDSLRIDLTVTNRGKKTLPFGCLFHPWLPRNEQTRLEFLARGVWLEDSTHLPTTHLDIEKNPDWNFSIARNFPDRGLNNAWTKWNGSARIMQGDEFVPLTVTASPSLDCAIVYTLNPDCDFFCFEPVSHVVDAHNQPGMPGLSLLEPGQSMTAWMKLEWAGLGC